LDWQRKKWGRLASAVLRVAERAAVQFPHETMVVSQTLQKHYRRHYGVETTYTPNGTIIRKRRIPSSRMSDWKIEPKNYVLYLGRYSPEKNCHQLIEAYERIRTPVKLVMAGGSSHSDAYFQELRKHESDRVRILEWVSGDALEELLTNAMLFVLPSDLEGLSLALLDAMGAAVCVLASDIPENREALDDTGFTFEGGRVNDLERMIRMLISDAQVREAAGRDAQKRARDHYMWPEIAAAVESVYRKHVESNSASDLPAMSARGRVD
jgi:glycosyltransferase involved in cell wall biosynthesis